MASADRVAAEFVDLELADLEAAFTALQLSAVSSATRKPLVTVERDVSELLAPNVADAIAASAQRTATRPLTHHVRRVLQCVLDVYALVAASPNADLRRSAGSALVSARQLLAATRTLLTRPSDALAQTAVVNAAEATVAFLASLHAGRLLSVDAAASASVPSAPSSDLSAAREQRSFLERERAKVLLSPRGSPTVRKDDDLNSPAAQAEAARLERALQRKPGALRDAKRKTWGAKTMEAEFAAEAERAAATPEKAPVATPVATPTPPAKVATPTPTSVRSPAAASPSPAASNASPLTGAAISAEQARLERMLNRGPRTSAYGRPSTAVNEDAVPVLTPEKRDRRQTWSAKKAEAEQTAAAAPASPAVVSPRGTAGFAQSVASIAKVASPRSSYSGATPTSTPPPRVSATRGDADRFSAEMSDLTRALGGSPADAAQKARAAEIAAGKRAAHEREEAERAAREREQARKDEEASRAAKKRAEELRQLAEQESRARIAALEKSASEDRAARQARREADLAAEREQARRNSEERAAQVAAEKALAAERRAAAERDAERAKKEREAAARATAKPATASAAAAKPATASAATAPAVSGASKTRTHAATASAKTTNAAPTAAASVVTRSVVSQVRNEAVKESGRARAGTVEKVMKATVKELTADDDDAAADDRETWNGLGSAMTGLVHELDDLAAVTSASGTPIAPLESSKSDGRVAVRSSDVAARRASDLSSVVTSAELDAERAALARERALLERERELLERERAETRALMANELERERLALERERLQLQQRSAPPVLSAASTAALLDSMISELRVFPLTKPIEDRLISKGLYRGHVSLTPLERDFVNELQNLRRAPRAYAQLLREARLPFFAGRQLNLPRKNGETVALASAEGAVPVLDVISQLETMSPLSDLVLVDGLTFAARDAIERDSLRPNAVERILEYGSAQGRLRQNVWMSSLPALEANDIVMAMLISDGDPKRTQRTALLSPEVHYLGVCAGHALQYAAGGHYLIAVLCEHFDD
jgi:hypothetical protein